MKCPVCGDNKSRALATKGIVFRHDRECKTCGSMWRPICPKRAAVLFCIAGAVVVLVALWKAVTGLMDRSQGKASYPDPLFWIALLPFGVGLLGYSVGVLLGRAGGPKIFHRGCKPGEIQQPESVGNVMTNSIGMKFVMIPPAEFLMGSPPDESGRSPDEGPVHRARISRGFWMGQCEVTQAQYEAVMGKNPSKFKGQNWPVERVSWEDATEFCEKLGQKEGRRYRLPTEAEWEYACRAGTTTRFSYGDNDSSVGEYAWYDSNSRGKTHPVGQKKPNVFGLYDMHGNVSEWCSDWYGQDYYSISVLADPQGPLSGKCRVLRGGSWESNPSVCRSAARCAAKLGIRHSGVGFRVVLELE